MFPSWHVQKFYDVFDSANWPYVFRFEITPNVSQAYPMAYPSISQMCPHLSEFQKIKNYSKTRIRYASEVYPYPIRIGYRFVAHWELSVLQSVPSYHEVFQQLET